MEDKDCFSCQYGSVVTRSQREDYECARCRNHSNWTSIGAEDAVGSDVLRVLCDTVVRLAELRQKDCGHLAVENFAPECLRNLIAVCTQNKGDQK